MIKKIGIVVAMSSEYDLTVALLENRKEKCVDGIPFTEGTVNGKSVVLMKCGIGKVCAAVGVVEMIKTFAPDCIINTGVAGGIDVSVRIMDIVIGKSMVYHDVWCGEGNEYGQVQGLPAQFHSDETLYQAAIAIRCDVNISGGLICSGDKFITDRSELNAIKERFPEGLAVDMESGAMAQVCYMYRIPFLSFRIISDTPGVKDHTAQYQNFWAIAPEKSFQVLKQLLTTL